MNIIEVEELQKKFGKKIIYDKVNLKIPNTGDFLILLGKSGSGKSTLINMLLGYDNKYEGMIKVLGKNIKNLSSKEYKKYLTEDVGIVYQNLKLYDKLTVLENLEFVASDESAIKYLKLFGLEELKDSKIFNLSGGQKQRIAIIRTLARNPKLLILDEPSSGLDDKTFFELMDVLNEVKKSTQILIITHDDRFEEIESLKYKIVNHQIKLLEETENIISDKKNLGFSKDLQEKKSTFKSIDKFSGMRRFVKNNKKIYIMKIIIMLIIMNIFLLFLGNMYNVWNAEYASYYDSWSDDVVILDIENQNKVYEYEGESYRTAPDKFSWSGEDKKEVENIKGVKGAYLFDSRVTNSQDEDRNTLDMDIYPEDYPSVILEKSSHIMGSDIHLSFESISIPPEVIPHYKIGNILGLNILSGDYPLNGNDVLIPDFIADQYIVDHNIYSSAPYENIINKSIKFNVYDNGKNSVIPKEKKYIISGVYDTEYEGYIEREYAIYTAFRSNKIPDDEMYHLYQSGASGVENGANTGYYAYSYESFEIYKKVIGYNELQMAILLDEGYTPNDISDELAQLFPDVIQESKEWYAKSSDFRNEKKYFLQLTLYIIAAISLIIIFILLIVLRGYHKNRKKDYSILLSLGYSKSDLFKMLMLEVLSDTLIISLFSIPIVYILSLIPLIIFVQSAQNFNIIILFFATILMILIGFINVVVINLGLKYKNLAKYLK